jgi:hypothetical protein
MKAIRGEVPLDIVIPSLQTSSDSEDKDIIGVLTKEGISRESSDVMELYRYLRQLNPKSNQAFGYNEVAIRNIHTRLNSLKVDEELRVQITYTERKENYIPVAYNIKLLGIFQISSVASLESAPEITETDTPEENIQDVPKQDENIQDVPKQDENIQDVPKQDENIQDVPKQDENIQDVPKQDENIQDVPKQDENIQDVPKQDENNVIPKDFPQMDPEIPVYKTTNTLEKLIAFTRTLQAELKETAENLTLMVERVQLLEEERQRYRDQENLLQDILDRLNQLENLNNRINALEADRHQLDKLQQTLTNYFKTSNRQTQALLNEVNDETDDINPEINPRSNRNEF